MNNSQNVWVDGSLRDGEWYGYLFKQIRRSVIAARVGTFDNATAFTDSTFDFLEQCSPEIFRSIESPSFTFPRRKKR